MSKREIKFRAWQDGNMLPSVCILLIDEWMAYPHGRSYIHDCTEWEGFGLMDKPIIMQYTGLKDKNGVEIYEGDIVRLNRSGYLGGNFEAEGTIEWHWHKWQWKRLPKFDSDEDNGVYPTCDIWASPTWLEVIGNIHQHPHLLTP